MWVTSTRPKRSSGAFDGALARGVDGEAVVLAGDLHLAGGLVQTGWLMPRWP